MNDSTGLNSQKSPLIVETKDERSFQKADTQHFLELKKSAQYIQGGTNKASQ